MTLRIISVGLLYTMLAACASSGTYPDLAIRDAERVSGTMQPPAAEPYIPPPPPAEIVDRIAQLRGEAAAAHERFLSLAPQVQRIVAANSSARTGSDGWTDAQVALANMASHRSSTMVFLADLDRIYVDAAVNAEQLNRIDSVREEVIAMVAAEDKIIDSLLARLN
ncbi:hypothetical protein [Altericroceibacterium endophyticum]|uniref:DUF4142 domain-containing protein n=1 Tax=Altericroceibacterium endophyticum TaxID=1808508 RepID=A0A6I4T9E4_9SPHN|nr:hypothetical protein [Altericroceibacterium endophyticum]MXO66902.1 hypothetical protein [Altericroceibacterium endophyticum]